MDQEAADEFVGIERHQLVASGALAPVILPFESHALAVEGDEPAVGDSNPVRRSKKFYDALFAAMGAQPGTEDARGRLAYSHNGGRFMVSKPIDGKPACHANGGTIGFVMKDAAQAEAWHKAGVANGGTSIEDPPGKRPNGAYLAYLRDPDGHKLVGVAR